ncbi:MAG: hypothetical protein Q8P83_02450 [bacterium]|nr:hypothetical protein [bacterium]
MNKNDLENLKPDWEKLNKEYDGHIQQILGDPNTKVSPEELERLKLMQQELFAIETLILKKHEDTGN